MDTNVAELKQVAVAVKGAVLADGRRVGPESGKVEIRCSATGKWYVENQGGIRAYTTDQGVRWICVVRVTLDGKLAQDQQGGFTSWKLANNWKAKRVGELRNAFATATVLTRPDRITVPQLFALYVDDLASINATPKQPILSMFRRIGAHPIFKDLLVSKITADIVEQYCKARKGERVQAATVQGEYVRLSMVLGYVLDRKKWAMFNPCNKHLRKRLRLAGLISDPKKRKRRPSPEELQGLRAHFSAPEFVKRNSLPMVDLIDFAIINAFRRGEQLVDEEDAQDEANEQYGLRFSALVGTRGVWCWRKDPTSDGDGDISKKGKRHCIVPLFPAAYEIIERQRARVEGDVIFPYNPSTVSKHFSNACKVLRKAALKADPASKLFLDLRWHDLRHEAISTFASILSTADGMAVSGHGSEENYRRYDNEDSHDADRISALGSDIKPKGY